MEKRRRKTAPEAPDTPPITTLSNHNLTMDVNSYITLSSHAPRLGPMQLPSPEHVERVESIPKEMTGLRKRYLHALQKNLTARHEYMVLVHDSSIKDMAPARANGQITSLSEHVELLRLKRRHQELRILQRYLTQLKQIDAAQTNFRGEKSRGHERAPPASVHHHDIGGNMRSDESFGALVRKLEIALVRARHQADRERQQLTQAEKNANLLSTSMKQKNRRHALAATRKELVAWMESKLSRSPSSESDQEDNLLREEQTLSHIQRLQNEISDEYTRYLGIRKKIIHLAATITTTHQQSHSRESVPPSQSVLPNPSFQSPATSLLPFILRQIRDPKQIHQFHRQQTAYITILSEKERHKTITELSRLADESHLLPAYSMHASQARFQRAAAAIASVPISDIMTVSKEEDEMDSRLSRWSSATHASTETTRGFVAGHLGKAGEAVEDGHEWLARLKTLLGEDQVIQHNETDARGSDHDDDEDVWALAAEPAQVRYAKRTCTMAKGPWVGLLGDIGLKRHHEERE